MDKKERKRLEELQKNGQKAIDDYYLKNLTYPDLQLLLLADPTIQRLIRQIVEPMFAECQQEETAKAESDTDDTTEDETPAAPVIEYRDREIIKEVIKTVIQKVPHEVRVEVPVYDPLREQLAPELKLLHAVKADAELAQAWLWADESEGRQLVRLLAVLAEWDEVLSLWSRLADRCKTDQRAATPTECSILQAALALHNLRYRNRAAQLATAEISAPFHHETMERGTSKGSSVAEIWLPGLTNAAGQLQKKPVVKTA